MAKSGDSKAEADLEILKSTVHTALALLTQLQQQQPAASAPALTTSAYAPRAEVDALDLAHDAASLIRAHSTKLSLLIINKPFTASAITTVLRELVRGPLPGLASAVELCDATQYTKVMNAELGYEVGRVFVECAGLVKAIPLDGKILSDDAKNGTGATKGRGSLALTGTVWQACDAVIGLKKMGIAGLVVKKAEQYRATLKDALEELQEWAEEEEDEEEEEHEGDAGSGDEEGDAQKEVDDMFGNQKHIPSDDPEKIRPKLEASLKRLRLLGMMYQAVVKRRFKSLPSLPLPKTTSGPVEEGSGKADVVATVDDVLEMMKKIPDAVDELASAYYELYVKHIDDQMEKCFLGGFSELALLKWNWKGEDDEFTVWLQKFQLAMKMDAIK
ncbi:hypothetical protein WAI453_003028 [Rhynchosporium graminicola]|uniref:Cyclin-D1-binding protein 1-like N-terminal domain-containing protein n=1 Tax=Rhynchosporium graminicola TaxID=2792576 RepID=A0A1E1LNR2_9HELO|nr:uncharacterized protein RCO7_11151 [Rhynchosporium commune]